MNVLIACERSGRVREAFARLGHHAVSCDLQKSDIPGEHIVGDAIEVSRDRRWDLVVSFPPCTDLAASGSWMWHRKGKEQKAAWAFAVELFFCPAPRAAMENPKGALSRLFRKPDQWVEPFMFGDSNRKKTGLWLRGLPRLRADCLVAPGESWIDRVSPSPERSRIRSMTPFGLASAMAEQWGGDFDAV